MVPKHHIIYLPGIGDHKDHGQIKILNSWTSAGIEVRYHRVGWAAEEPLDIKIEKVVKLINKLDGRVSVVGVSAGASLAINVMAACEDKVLAVVLICGKFIKAQKIGPNYSLKNPILKESVEQSEQNLKAMPPYQKQKILSIRPIFDNVVPVADMVIPGATNQRIVSFWHIPSIFLAITIYRRSIISFIKAKNLA